MQVNPSQEQSFLIRIREILRTLAKMQGIDVPQLFVFDINEKNIIINENVPVYEF